MKSFIEECVETLHNHYGSNISDVTIIMPSKRATLFFNRALNNIVSKEGTPIWQPKYYSIGEVFSSLTDAVVADKIRLLSILYSVYSQYHKESFDSFYYWGDMLLNDFEAIDNYMVDARKVFENSGDLREIESRFDYINDEDAEEIARFWRIYNSSRNSSEKEYFFNIWKTLYPIYCEFKRQLRELKIGYQGMICRDVAEKLISKEIVIPTNSLFAAIGFNVLSSTEKILFDSLKANGSTLFMWDSDKFYLNAKNNEAGFFLRQNIASYGEDNKSTKDNYKSEKEITILKSPSKSIESRYVWEFIEKCQQRAISNGEKLGAETAIILTDESMLMPVLHAIPSYIEHINITAGYEVRLTMTYNIIESLISLQTTNDTEFYYKDISLIVSNPLLQSIIEKNTLESLQNVLKSNKIYYKSSELSLDNTTSNIFHKRNGWRDISNYLLWIINRVAADTDIISKSEHEALYKCYNAIKGLCDSLTLLDEGIMSDKIYYSLLRKHLSRERISYEGEPLIGIQVMGILESRTLDFENVLILSVEEDNFPSKSIGASFIPVNLRDGYGMPTARHHQSIYSYYFYRLLQRANMVDISYVSSGDEMSSGEPTRYIHQLKYDNTHITKEINLTVDLSLKSPSSLPITKEGDTLSYINSIKVGKRAISASSFYNYLICPVRFYYDKILKIDKEEQSREIEFNAIERGNTLHHSIEDIYKPLINMSNNDTLAHLSRITDDKIKNIVEEHINRWAGEHKESLSADILYNTKTISRYIRNIINYDLQRKDGFTIAALEEPVNGTIAGVPFYGEIDRVDRLANGGYMIIDYKSGSSDKPTTIDDLFFSSKKSKPYIQSFIYCHLFSQKNGGVNTTPALYHVGEMAAASYSPHLNIKDIDSRLQSYSYVSEVFEANMKVILTSLLDTTTPFERCEDVTSCTYCDFSEICSLYRTI